MSTTDFENDINKLSKKELQEKYERNKAYSFDYLKKYHNNCHSLEEEKEFIDNYSEQMNLYAKNNDDVHYKPFGLLKVINENNEEYILGTDETERLPNELILNQGEIFSLLGDDPILNIDLTEEDWYERLSDFYKITTFKNKMEGLVLKNQVFSKNTANFVKVRNENYLSIIYGYNYKYPPIYKKLIEQKSIKSKLKQSIKEYNLGLEMLKQPYNSINKDNKDYVINLVKFIDDYHRASIDPRL